MLREFLTLKSGNRPKHVFEKGDGGGGECTCRENGTEYLSAWQQRKSMQRSRDWLTPKIILDPPEFAVHSESWKDNPGRETEH